MIDLWEQKGLDKLEIEISRSGYARLDKEWKHANVMDPYSRLYYVKKGRGYLQCDGKTIALEAGSCYLVPAGTMFSYWCEEGEELEKVYFHISLVSVEHYDLFTQVHGIFSISMEEAGAEEIFDCYGKDRYWSMMQIKTILYRTVTCFFEKCGMKKTPVRNYSDTVRNAMRYIQRNLSIRLKTEEIAKNLFISESTLRKLFKAETGMTLGDYIDELIFLKAKRMLVKKGISLKDISTRLGFCDQFYFSRRFKEKYGTTPSQYRREASI